MSNSSTIYNVQLDHQGAAALIIAHQNGLLGGDGAPERLRLLEAVMDPVRKHDASGKPQSDFSLEIKVSSDTVKAWLAGAANSIMRHAALADGTPMNDTHAALLFGGAKALGFVGELRKRIPVFPAGEELLVRDEEPAELERDDAPVSDPAPSGGSAVAESSAPAADIE